MCGYPTEEAKNIASKLLLEHTVAIDAAIKDLHQSSGENANRFPTVVRRYYGVCCEKATLATIGEGFASPVGPERVRMLRQKAESVMRRNIKIKPVVAYLEKLGFKGDQTVNTLALTSPEEIQFLVNSDQPTGTFLASHFLNCSEEDPCPTCQAKAVLESAGVLDAVMKLFAEWQAGPTDDYRSVRVSTFNFSARTANGLIHQKIFTVGQLENKSRAELLRVPNYGRKSVNEIIAKLAEYGLSLKDS
jgi:hypothetical protein